MPLLSFLESNPTTVATLHIQQILMNAGDGKLRDDSACSGELRNYFAEAPSERLREYATHCLTKSFQDSGLVLQDLVNELGRRLDYQVENGRYQGTPANIGFDGIWHSPEGHDIVIEVKTTDSFTIRLNTLAGYRDKLRDIGKIAKNASMLIVVGREDVDTTELEAQVRGSRHAWEMRLISVDALFRLAELKANTESGLTGAKIRNVLIPMEYTRLDGLIDVMVTTAKDVESTVESENPEPQAGDEETAGWQFTEPHLLQATREGILSALGKQHGKQLIKWSRALYWDATHSYRVVCTISKRYTKKGQNPYWYAYHPQWDSFLGEGSTGYVILGCVDGEFAFVVPLETVRAHLHELSTSDKKDGGHYWHLKILEPQPGHFALQLPKSSGQLPLDQFMLKVSE